MDVKVGSGAFLPERARGRALARTLIALGRRLGLPVRALLTDMDQPLGAAIGNAVEVREAIDVLRGGGPDDVRALTVRLGAEMLVLGRVARDRRDGARRIEAAIASGAGLERFILGVRLQGGDPRAIDDPRRLPRARHTRLLRAPRSGVVTRVDAGLLGRAATLLGAGRLRKEDRIAFGAAILLHAKVGTRVARGDALATIEFDDDARERAARPLYERAFALGSRAPRPRPLVLEALG
jgi:pyrimidine-nucleoside phosphorylase/thymidine phosphorylase